MRSANAVVFTLLALLHAPIESLIQRVAMSLERLIVVVVGVVEVAETVPMDYLAALQSSVVCFLFVLVTEEERENERWKTDGGIVD